LYVKFLLIQSVSPVLAISTCEIFSHDKDAAFWNNINKMERITNEKFFRAITEQSVDPISVLSLKGDILYASPTIAKVLGYDNQEVLLKNLFSLMHSEDVEKISVAWKEMLKIIDKDISVQAYRMMHKDGTWRWIQSSFKNILHDPEVKGILYTFKDVTENLAVARQNLLDKYNLEALVNNTRDYMWSVDRDFKLMIGNKAFVEVIRSHTGNILNKGDSIFIEGLSDIHYSKYKKIFERVFKGEIVTEIEYTEKPIEGWSEIKYNPIWDEHNVIGAACHSRNISDIKLAERRQKFENQKLEALINNTQDMIWSVDNDLNLITGNRPFINMLHSVIGKEVSIGDKIVVDNLNSEISRELILRYRTNYKRAFAGEVFTSVDHIEFPQEMWVQVSFNPLYFDEAIIGVVCHSKIITDIVKADQERRRKEMRLKESQALAKLGHWELNFANGEALWSDEFCRIFGLPIEDNRHTFEEWLSYIHPEDVEEVMAAIAINHESFHDMKINHRIVLHDGTVKYIASKTKFEFDQSEKIPVGLYGVAYDFTTEKEAEMQMKQKAKELALSNAQLEQFAYSVSRDLQEPLRMVTGFLNQLEKKYSHSLEEKAQQYIYYAVDGAKRMRQIILDLLEFSKVGKIEEELTDVDLNDVVYRVKVLLDKQIKDNKAVIQHESLPILRSNKSFLNLIFQNLISNSLKYTVVGVAPYIIINSKEEKTYWSFSVSDNGIGIDKIYFDKIFAIFQRLHTREEYTGNGIGLSITKKIIEHMGGKIWVESEIGNGSVFYFNLPK